MATTYLDQMLDPITAALTPEAAQRVLQARLTLELASHIEELRQKANEGPLTTEEEADYKEFVEALDVISIIQAKARRMLAPPSAQIHG